MRARSVGYDTGFSFDGISRRPFDDAVVRRELEIIRDDLYCNAVRLFGNDMDRLELAASYAADLGLEVWFSPFTYQLGPEEMLDLLADAAQRAEPIRLRGAEVVFVTGAPRGNRLDDRARTDRRIAAFVAAGLEDFRIRTLLV